MRHFIFLFYFLFFACLTFGQIGRNNFHQISPTGGLSYEAIYKVTQDKTGYIWLGTYQGIYKYDSQKFQRFHHNTEDSTSLLGNRVSAIIVDNYNKLWVGSQNGLNLFNRKTQSFTHYRYKTQDGKPAGQSIYSLCTDPKGNIWVADSTGAGILDTTNHIIKLIQPINSDDYPILIHFDKQNRGWVGTEKGYVYRINPNELTFKHVIKSPGSHVQTIFTENNKIWVGYFGHGARLYDTTGRLIKHYSYDKDPSFDIKNSNIRDIKKDRKGNLWIGTYLGLYMEKDNLLYRFNPEEYPDLPHSSIFSIFEDKVGGIWFGTWAGGLSYLHIGNNKFNNYRHGTNPTSLSNNIVSSFTQSPTGEIYVGTEVGGLNIFDPQKQQFQKIQLNTPLNKAINIKALCSDRYGGLWVGSHNHGLWYKKNGESTFTHFPEGPKDGKHVSCRDIYCLCPSQEGIWIGSYGGGVEFYDFKTRKIVPLQSIIKDIKLANKYIRSLYLDHNKDLWIGTYYGLYCVDLKEKKVSFPKQYQEPRINEYIFHINELSDGTIWVGTKGGGIFIINPETDNIKRFDANGILNGKDVYGIIEDQNNGVWITSNDGLIFYNTQKKTIRHFLAVDGIQGNQFTPHAVFKDSEDNIYLGGTNGFTQVTPGTMTQNRHLPDILINKLIINNHKTIFPEIGDPLKNQILSLNSHENALKIEFTANNYLSPEKNLFKYRLVNFDDDWISTENSGIAIFTNIPSGKYIFEAKACNNDGIWNPKPTQLKIIIADPWWRTPWAYILYLILVSTIITILWRNIKEKQKLKKAVLIEKIQREHEEKSHEMKLKFFTNISHEFRTPLTLINGPVKQLISDQNSTSRQKEMLEVIQRNSNRLLTLINQILDLRKIEKGQNKLNISRFDLIEFTHERVHSFSQEAIKKQIKFDYQYPQEKLFVEADKEMIDKIIFNLLSNAFKFTPVKKQITIAIGNQTEQDHTVYSSQLRFGNMPTDEFFEISIKDTGVGIESEDLLNIFNRFERGNASSQNSSGIGLSLCKEYTLLHKGEVISQSTPGKGTRFTVRLPLKQSAQQIIYGINHEEKKLASWQESSSIESEEKHTPTTSGSTILIVEDNKDLQNYIINILAPFYQTRAASNGSEALNLIKTGSYDLILSDVMMPIMDGFELCKNTKSNIETSHIPVILLTALSSTQNKIMGLDKGADAYISKPFENELLLSQINNLITQRQKLRSSFKSHVVTGEAFDAGNLDNYFLKKVDEVIEKMYSKEDFSVENLANEVSLHRSQLHRKLKQLTNYSATEYIRTYRLKKAAEHLQKGEYNIDEIAYLIGFGSHSYFSKCFKELYEVSPKAYRQKFLNS